MNNISSMHCTRKGCKDVFHAFLVKNATYDSPLEIPCLKAETRTPKRLIAFSKAAHSTETDAWVHFYEDDIAFERLWNRPKTYLPVLQKFKGVISPDFSVYRDMPLVMQQWNIYRSRALAHWLQENGVPVIPNIRFSDDRTFELACAGISRHAVIAIGSHGCISLRESNSSRFGTSPFPICLAPFFERRQPIGTMELRRLKKGGGTNFLGTETGQNFCSVVAEERRYTGVFQATKHRRAEI